MMKKILLFLAGIQLCISNDMLAQGYFKNAYAATWERSMQYTMQVASEMPDSLYNYKPTDDAFSFAEQMQHITQNIGFLCSKILEEKIIFETDSTKATILQKLREAGYFVSRLIAEVDSNTLNQEIAFAGESISKETIFYLIRDHMAHHRGQAVMYLRLNAIDPPRYVGW